MTYNDYLEYLLRICNGKDFLCVYLYISILYHTFSLYYNNVDLSLVLLILYPIDTFKEWPVMLMKEFWKTFLPI